MSDPSRLGELDVRLARVRTLLGERGLRGALFAGCGGFAWITGGGQNHVSIAAERGVGAVLVTPDAALLLADNIENRRLLEEELAGLPLETVEFSWWTGSLALEALRLVPAPELAADVPVPGARILEPLDAVRLRTPLLPLERDAYRKLGEDVAVSLTHAALSCRPGLSEHQLAGLLGGVLLDLGATPAVLLAAVDERVASRRHPIPTAKRLERYAMLVVGARRRGLHVSATRLVHFGRIPGDLQARQRACARVDAAFLAATRPGAALTAVFDAGRNAYAAEGWPEEWRRHHQGGPTGYAGRDLKVGPDTPGEVSPHQAFAWNPSIAGVKSEDTVLVREDGLEILSATPDLPTLPVEADGRLFDRPGILER